MTPGHDAELVGIVSAVLHGSLTPAQILGDLSYAYCQQLRAIYWSDIWNRETGGIASERPREMRTNSLASVL